MQSKIQNATPLNLTLRLQHESLSDPITLNLKSLETIAFELPDDHVESNEQIVQLSINDESDQFQIGQMKFHSSKPKVIIGLGSLHSYQYSEKDLAFYPVDLLAISLYTRTFPSKHYTGNPFGQWLFNQLSAETQTLLNVVGSRQAARMKIEKFLEDLNKLILGPLIYDAERFSINNIQLREDTNILLSRKPKGVLLQLLNRMLLEDAYPGAFKRFSPLCPVRELCIVNNTTSFADIYRQNQHNTFLTNIAVPPMENRFCEISRVGQTYIAKTVEYRDRVFTVTGKKEKIIFSIDPTPTKLQQDTSSSNITNNNDVTLIVNFVNKTGRYVNLHRKDMLGNEKLISAPLAADEKHSAVSLVGELYIARSTFTGDLLGSYLIDNTIKQPLVIKDDFREKREKKFPLPSPIPEISTVDIITSDRKKPDPRSKDYVTISDKVNLAKEQFNTLPNLPTRTVKISGVELVWDKFNDESGLMNYQGESITDIESLEIFADRVVISSPLRFPGTEVKIFTRELEFKGDGKIDTTPIEYKSPAISQFRTAEGKPADKDGNPTYQAADGLPGEAGGDIHLNVRKLVLPDSAEKKERLVTRGTKGQKAEAGGLKAYEQGTQDQPVTGESKNITNTVTTQMIVDHLKVKGNYSINSPNDYRWPGEVRHPRDIIENGKKFFPDEGGNFTHLKLAIFIDRPFVWTDQVLILPDGKNWLRHGQQTPIGKELDTDPGKDPKTPRRPGNGEDAYPGGQPGNGGQGGTIYTTELPDVIHSICDYSGGEPGDPSPPIKGGPKGKPVPAYSVGMVIVNYDPVIAADRKPYLVKKDVTSRDGRDAPERTAEQGPYGGFVCIDNNYGWMHPDAIDAVLACAKDAYRNGHREFAASLLDPYYAELKYALKESEKISTIKQPEALTIIENLQLQELPCKLPVIEGLRIRLLNNLDFYGNPPGWLPRLNLSSNFDIFQSVRKISSKLLYYALNMEEEYERLDNRSELAGQTQQVLEEEIKISEEQLKSAFTDLTKAIQDLEKVSEFVKEKRGEIEYLQNWALQDAQQRVAEQKIFRGVMKLIGGLMSAIPVGQPYLGLAGNVTSQIGDFNWTKPEEIPNQIVGTLNGISTTTSAFLEDNKDLIVADRVKGLKDNLKGWDKNRATLEENVLQVKGSINLQEKEVQRIKDSWKANNQKEIDENKKILEELKNYLEEEKEYFNLTEKKKKEQIAKIEHLKKWSEQDDIKAIIEYQNGVEQSITLLEESAKKEKKAALAPNFAKLKSYKNSVARLDQRVKEVKDKRQAAAAGIKARETKIGKTVDRLQGIAEGIPAITQAVATLVAPTTKDDPEVIELAESILRSEKKEQYDKLINEFKAQSEIQNAAMSQLGFVQQNISTSVAGITESLMQLNNLSHTRQSLDSGLDLRVKRYIKDMQERARDGLRWAIYNFVMAYRYETLADVNDTLYNLDKMVDAIRKLKGVENNTWKLGYDQFDEDEIKVIESEFLSIYIDCIDKRQHKESVRKNKFPVQLTEKHREFLRLNGKLTFNLVRDYDLLSFNDQEARVTDFDGLEMDLVFPDENHNFRVVLKHSGESVILNDKRYYWFDSGNDDPISWGFNYVGKKEARKDVQNPNSDLLNKFLRASGEDIDIEYLEYYPSFFGDITLVLNPGREWKADYITKINEISFEVEYMSAGVRS